MESTMIKALVIENKRRSNYKGSNRGVVKVGISRILVANQKPMFNVTIIRRSVIIKRITRPDMLSICSSS